MGHAPRLWVGAVPTPTLALPLPLQKRTKTVHRRDTNPEVPFSAALDKTLIKLRSMPEVSTRLVACRLLLFVYIYYIVIYLLLLFTLYVSTGPQAAHFQKPVSAKQVPDYYTIIKFPMDLQTIKEVCTQTSHSTPPLTTLTSHHTHLTQHSTLHHTHLTPHSPHTALHLSPHSPHTALISHHTPHTALHLSPHSPHLTRHSHFMQRSIHISHACGCHTLTQHISSCHLVEPSSALLSLHRDVS